MIGATQLTVSIGQGTCPSGHESLRYGRCFASTHQTKRGVPASPFFWANPKTWERPKVTKVNAGLEGVGKLFIFAVYLH